MLGPPERSDGNALKGKYVADRIEQPLNPEAAMAWIVVLPKLGKCSVE
jgi:hypothetical protein